MIMAKVWRNERYSGRERKSTRIRWQSGTGGRPSDEREGKEHGAEKETKRVGARREGEGTAGRRWKKDAERGTEGEESGPFDGAFVGSRGALRFATKIVALPTRARRSALRRVICCEFINATIARRSNARRFVPSLGRAGFGTRAYSIELLNFQVERGFAFLLTELRYGRLLHGAPG